MKAVWQKIKSVASSRAFLAVFTLLAYAEIYVFVSSSFFERDRSLFGPAFIGILLLSLSIALTLFFGVSLFLAVYRKEGERNGVFCLVAEIVALLFGAALPILTYYGRMTESVTFLKTLPYFAAGLVAIATLFLIPLAKKKAILAFVAVAVFVGLSAGVTAISANGEKLEFEAAPVVFDTGKDFSVVWCTNAVSVGYLEYTYGDQKYVVYDASDGKYRLDRRVHTVRVPYEHLYGNTYTVASAKVLRNASRDPKLGTFIKSKGYKFADKVTGDELKMLSLTDWHEKTDRAATLAEMRSDYDLLLVMGDEINYVNEFEDIINFAVIPAGKITGGVKPALFVRGNHEIRGKYSGEIKSVIGLENYYFTTSYGEVNFLIFDGGDTKPDEDAEFGVVNVCESYREKQLAEMEALPVIATGYNVCLCHIPLFSREILDEEPKGEKADEQYERFAAILAHHEVKLEIAGHEHFLDYTQGGASATLIAGGPTEANGYVACFITVKAGVANIEAYNAEGTVATYGPLALR
ncbi:MAG: metallophosphoesterase [Clostridia bacterium]|nr:metallophosphoesterase [Clostridia bacterium]